MKNLTTTLMTAATILLLLSGCGAIPVHHREHMLPDGKTKVKSTMYMDGSAKASARRQSDGSYYNIDVKPDGSAHHEADVRLDNNRVQYKKDVSPEGIVSGEVIKKNGREIPLQQ